MADAGEDNPREAFKLALRQVIDDYHLRLRWDETRKKHRDPFIDWFQSVIAEIPNPQLRVLLVLVNARFDRGGLAERALANTQAVYYEGLLARENATLEEVPPLNAPPRVNREKWRELFKESLPQLQHLSLHISEQRVWSAGRLLNAIKMAKIPHFKDKTGRLAVRWLSELVPEVSVDMKDSEVPVDRLVYRVAARLGIIDPQRDPYSGPRSRGHAKIQDFARALFPDNPSRLDEPLWMMGRQPRNGGFCYPTAPACDAGCILARHCPRLFTDRDPVDLGYSRSEGAKARGAVVRRREQGSSAEPYRNTVPGLLVIVSCVKIKIWDIDSSAPKSVPAERAYRGDFFDKNSTYARKFGEQWCVLSAKFGFVLPNEEIENYNCTFKHYSPELVSTARLIEQVRENRLDRFETIQVLGGAPYVQRVREAFDRYPVKVEAPLAGLGIGAMKHRVRESIDSNLPLGHGHQCRMPTIADFPSCTIEVGMTIESLRSDKRDSILRIAAKRGAKNVRVFGSVARGESDQASDIDFLVDLEPGRTLFDLSGLLADLEALLQQRVDVVTERGLRPRIRERVLAEAIPL